MSGKLASGYMVTTVLLGRINMLLEGFCNHFDLPGAWIWSDNSFI